MLRDSSFKLNPHTHTAYDVSDQLAEFRESDMKLLVVEDEQDLRQALVMGLEDEGYAVDAAEDGEEGLYKAQEWDYDAIILDIMMPIMDGWEMLAQLRNEKNTPVLILTARGDIDDRVKGLDLGSDDFWLNPSIWPS